MLQKALKEEALSHTQVFERFARLKRGEMSIEDHPHSGRPSTSRTDENVEKIREKINKISEATGVNWSSCQRILTMDLNMRRAAVKFVPRLLTQDQKKTQMRKNLQRKCPELWRSGDWFLHYDNAPAHTALSVTRYLASLVWPVVPLPPYSPDLAPCDFFLFPTMKKAMKGKRFATVKEVKTASQEALNNIKLQQFQRCFTQWEKRLDKCIASNGEYFKRD